MDSVVTAAQVPLLKAQFAANMHAVLATLTAAKISQPMHLVHRHGAAGFEVAYDFTIDSTPFHGITDILLKGHHEYQVTGQASQKAWPTIGPQLQAAVASFRPV